METDAHLTGGPLTGRYAFAQFHAHWGRQKTWGSEHTLDGLPFSGELHMVFYNADKYSTVDDALMHPDGLAVLGRWIQQSDTSNEECEVVKEVIEKLTHIRHADDKEVQVTESLHLPNLLPNTPTQLQRAYYTYHGSLTTPPCHECVTWIVFRDPIKFSQAQMDTLRGLSMSTTSDKEKIPCVDNYRHTVPLGTRPLRTPY